MRVTQICSRPASHMTRDTTVAEAARRMRDEHIGNLVVVDLRHGRPIPVGLITDRDLVVGLLAKGNEPIGEMHVGDIVGGTLVTASEDEDLAPVLRRMRSFSVRRVPVVDAHGTLVGILSADDVLPALAAELADLAALVSDQPRREREHLP